jgi:hypothetical protein
MPPKETGYKKYLTYFKDFVYVITILFGLFAYIRNNAKHEAVMETTVKQNTETLVKVEKFMEEQTLLNGKVIQFMAMDIH